MKHNNVLVTGGAGFVGSHLTETLLETGHRVTVIDNLSTGRWSNIDHLKEHPNLRVIIASVADLSLMEGEVARTDLVYHLASSVGVKLIIDRPVETVENTFLTSHVVLRAASKFRKPVLITSSSEVYGKALSVPFRESDDVVMGPTEKRRWAYACAKALDEFMALAHFYETSLPVFIVRLFNTVGPRQVSQYGMVIPTFVRQALDGSPITVYGDGRQKRCFCSVGDAVEALIALPQVPQAAGQVVNVGSQEEVSILDLAEQIKAACQSDSEIVLVPYETAYGPGFDDMQRRVPDLTRVRELIGWKPQRTLDHIIRQVVADLRESSGR